jgi:hypothetical protein
MGFDLPPIMAAGGLGTLGNTERGCAARIRAFDRTDRLNRFAGAQPLSLLGVSLTQPKMWFSLDEIFE